MLKGNYQKFYQLFNLSLLEEYPVEWLRSSWISVILDGDEDEKNNHTLFAGRLGTERLYTSIRSYYSSEEGKKDVQAVKRKNESCDMENQLNDIRTSFDLVASVLDTLKKRFVLLKERGDADIASRRLNDLDSLDKTLKILITRDMSVGTFRAFTFTIEDAEVLLRQGASYVSLSHWEQIVTRHFVKQKGKF